MMTMDLGRSACCVVHLKSPAQSHRNTLFTNSSLIPSAALSFVSVDTSYDICNRRADEANMAGATGSVGVNKVAKEQLNTNNPYAQHWSTPRSGRFMEVPFRFWGSVLGAACLASVGLLWLNRRMYHSTPDSMTPEFQEAVRKHGPVAERSGAPPVFLNPITNRIPGYIRGPDDIKDV